MFLAIILGLLLIAWFYKYEELRLLGWSTTVLKQTNQGVLFLFAIYWLYGVLSDLSDPVGLLWRPGARVFPVVRVICTVIWVYLFWWFRKLRLKEIMEDLKLDRWRSTARRRLSWTVVICGFLGLGAISVYDRMLCGLDYYFGMIGSIAEIVAGGIFVMPFLVWIQGFGVAGCLHTDGNCVSTDLQSELSLYQSKLASFCLNAGMFTMLLGIGLHWWIFRSRQELVFLPQSVLVLIFVIRLIKLTNIIQSLSKVR